MLLIFMTVMSFQTVKASPTVHCAEDSVKVTEILAVINQKGGTLGERVVTAAQSLEGIPWGPSWQADSIGTLTVDLHKLDRLEFINTAMALAFASQKAAPSFKDFETEYEKMSRRKGIDDGYASQLIYSSEWIVDNIHRGNLKEMTEYLTGGGFRTKTLDRLSRNRADYPALKDSVTFDKIKMIEMGYRSHRIPHLKKQSISNKQVHELLAEGDIIIMLAPDTDYDLYDIGIVDMKDGIPYLIHIPYDRESVVRDEITLPRRFKIDGQHFYGYRWLRPAE